MADVDQHRLNNQHSDFSGSDFLSAREAATLLDVKLPTLYAYVSRGLVRSVAGAKGRPRRYARADIERLKARRDARRGHGAVAAGALRWGEPVLDSAITEIAPSGHRYRGHGARELAAERSFEDVVELLWTGRLPDGPRLWDEQPDWATVAQINRLVPDDAGPLERLAALVPLMAVGDPDRHNLDDEVEMARGRRLLVTMAAAVGPGPAGADDSAAAASQPMAARLLRARVAAGAARRIPRGKLRAVERALILVADHELNVSAFAARVAASAGSDLYSCVSAGLGALAGPLHGGMCERVEALIHECQRPEQVREVLRQRDRRGEEIPGFGHRLYPERGDPRTEPLLSCARQLAGRNRQAATVFALAEAMAADRRQPPTVDIGLVALCSALRLRSRSAAAFYGVGRAAGWVAHSLEQRRAGFLLRPRARYVPDGPG
ncbi:MAG: citrate synthase family protein [Myxococcota bacterium]